MDTRLIHDRHFMKMITDLAKDHVPGNGIKKKAKLCAIITIRNKLVSIGFNSDKTHPFCARFAKHKEAIYSHAETQCIHRALKGINPEDLKKATIYIGRVKGKKDDWGLAKPCAGCMGAIKHYKLKRIVYSLDINGGFEEMLLV